MHKRLLYWHRFWSGTACSGLCCLQKCLVFEGMWMCLQSVVTEHMSWPWSYFSEKLIVPWATIILGLLLYRNWVGVVRLLKSEWAVMELLRVKHFCWHLLKCVAQSWPQSTAMKRDRINGTHHCRPFPIYTKFSSSCVLIKIIFFTILLQPVLSLRLGYTPFLPFQLVSGWALYPVLPNLCPD